MRQDVKLKGKLKGYTQTPLVLTALFGAMDVWMYVLNTRRVFWKCFRRHLFFCDAVCVLAEQTDPDE